MRRTHVGEAVAVAAALLGAVALSSPAQAATRGTAYASQQATSGSWAALATTSSVPPYTKSALTLNFGSRGTQIIFFNVVNTGTLTLRGATYTLSGANLNGGSVTVGACAGGVWNTSTYTCSGTATAIVSSTGSATSVSVTQSGTFPASGGSVQFLAYLSATPVSSSTGTFSVSVSSPTQVRTGQTTNG